MTPRTSPPTFPPGLIVNPQAVPHCQLADYFRRECAGPQGRRRHRRLPRLRHGFQSAFKYHRADAQPRTLRPLPRRARPHSSAALPSSSSPPASATALTTASPPPAPASRPASTTSASTSGASPPNPPTTPSAARSARAPGDHIPVDYYGIYEDYLGLPELEEDCANAVGAFRTAVLPKHRKSRSSPCPPNAPATRSSIAAAMTPGSARTYAETSAQLPPVEGCNALSFEPTIEARPTTNLADAPSGLEFNLHVPQSEDSRRRRHPRAKRIRGQASGRAPPQPRLRQRAAPAVTEAQANLHVRSALGLPRSLQARRSRSHQLAAARTAQGLPLPRHAPPEPLRRPARRLHLRRRPGDQDQGPGPLRNRSRRPARSPPASPKTPSSPSKT